jgi:preprotein translocase subunit SecG
MIPMYNTNEPANEVWIPIVPHSAKGACPHPRFDAVFNQKFQGRVTPSEVDKIVTDMNGKLDLALSTYYKCRWPGIGFLVAGMAFAGLVTAQVVGAQEKQICDGEGKDCITMKSMNVTLLIVGAVIAALGVCIGLFGQKSRRTGMENFRADASRYFGALNAAGSVMWRITMDLSAGIQVTTTTHNHHSSSRANLVTMELPKIVATLSGANTAQVGVSVDAGGAQYTAPVPSYT